MPWFGAILLCEISIGAGVLAGGLAGHYMAAFAFGGIVSKPGFGMLALAWLRWVPNVAVAEWLVRRPGATSGLRAAGAV